MRFEHVFEYTRSGLFADHRAVESCHVFAQRLVRIWQSDVRNRNLDALVSFKDTQLKGSLPHQLQGSLPHQLLRLRIGVCVPPHLSKFGTKLCRKGLLALVDY